jgi:hypothetical protein
MKKLLEERGHPFRFDACGGNCGAARPRRPTGAKTQEKKLLALSDSKHGAGRSMDGLDQDDPATGIGPARWLLKTWNRMFQGRTGTASPSYGEEGSLFPVPGGDE